MGEFKKCRECGEDITKAKYQNRRYCSDKCYRIYTYKRCLENGLCTKCHGSMEPERIGKTACVRCSKLTIKNKNGRNDKRKRIYRFHWCVVCRETFKYGDLRNKMYCDNRCKATSRRGSYTKHVQDKNKLLWQAPTIHELYRFHVLLIETEYSFYGKLDTTLQWEDVDAFQEKRAA